MRRTWMSQRELRRLEVLSRVKEGELQLVNAAELVGVSYRQAKRLWKRYREQGPEGLKHRSAGRRSNRAKPERFREKVLRLVRSQYGGEEGKRFGPTLAAEHLESDDGLKVNAETLRLWMVAAGLWSRQRKRKQHRKRRERKKHLGELVQLDGSFHDWLEGRGPELCLLNLVDDATGTTLSQLHEQETIWAAADVLRAWVETYGVPHALYTDWKNVYVREPTEAEWLAGEASRLAGIWADVPEARDADYPSQLPAGQGAGGAEPRDPAGPADPENAAAEDRDDRGSEPVSAATRSAGSQPAVSTGARLPGGLSPAGAGPARVGSDFPAGGRADDQQRLGGEIPGAVFANRAGEPVRPGGREGDGVGGARGQTESAVSRPRGELARDSRASAQIETGAAGPRSCP